MPDPITKKEWLKKALKENKGKFFHIPNSGVGHEGKYELVGEKDGKLHFRVYWKQDDGTWKKDSAPTGGSKLIDEKRWKTLVTYSQKYPDARSIKKEERQNKRDFRARQRVHRKEDRQTRRYYKRNPEEL